VIDEEWMNETLSHDDIEDIKNIMNTNDDYDIDSTQNEEIWNDLGLDKFIIDSSTNQFITFQQQSPNVGSSETTQQPASEPQS
jgi:hypothetical protein